jgi:hypothetical protein
MPITEKQVEAALVHFAKGNHTSDATLETRMRAALEAADAAAWEPIETAPKDGTEILVETSDGVTIGAYGKDGPIYWLVPNYQDQEDRDLCSPTHWRPLPSPPVEG